MKVIITRLYPPTVHFGARMSARIADETGIIKRVWRSYDHTIDVDKNHAIVAKRLKSRLGWDKPMVSGHLPNGERVWVFVQGKRI